MAWRRTRFVCALIFVSSAVAMTAADEWTTGGTGRGTASASRVPMPSRTTLVAYKMVNGRRVDFKGSEFTVRLDRDIATFAALGCDGPAYARLGYEMTPESYLLPNGPPPSPPHAR